MNVNDWNQKAFPSYPSPITRSGTSLSWDVIVDDHSVALGNRASVEETGIDAGRKALRAGTGCFS